MKFSLKPVWALLPFVFVANNGHGGVNKTLDIDVFPDRVHDVADIEAHPIVFDCQLGVDKLLEGDGSNFLSPRMSIIKMDHKNHTLVSYDSEGKMFIFTGYTDDFQWEPFASTYQQDVQNDWDALGAFIDLQRVSGRQYQGYLLADLYNYIPEYFDEEESTALDLSCTYIEDQQGNAGLNSLMQAALFGDTNRIRSLLSQGDFDVNSQTTDGFSALMFAVMNRYTKSAQLLLNAGADVNLRNRFGNDVLNYAVHLKHHKLIGMLSEAGATGGARSLLGESALTLAIKNGFEQTLIKKSLVSRDSLPYIIELLSPAQLLSFLGIGLDIEARKEVEDRYAFNGATALHIAARNNNLEQVKILVEAGADIESKRGKGPAIQNNQGEWVYSEYQGNPLYYTNDLAVAGYLLGKGAQFVVNSGFSPLHEAMNYKSVELIRFMMNQGQFDIKAVDYIGRDFLTCIMNNLSRWRPDYQEKLDIIEDLVALGADARAVSAYGNTALFEAARSNELELAKLFIDLGAQVNIVNASWRNTPYAVAKSYGYEDMVKLLLNAGADPEL
ncbi:ankyrin repeat domain-containing protein [Pseudobacteriovorax antillogorgiicola]|uniref:Ankyrin repeat n=1 Tax=Pseudobacteriovorax antillogorgiicola TaxID=1513793 RepID=A0A1Y6BN43_9BACT|nr:ankyrin repeat domain-containing protein [Pseudobacteriovorax antillogorgiicola]TCS55446.1 ankyrin repeat protein [Pseudobacteriovorax antillogorgiicola]SMF12361.1 Ankyrin repeat [Pseudobacteriovorax antillogorgiicola]